MGLTSLSFSGLTTFSFFSDISNNEIVVTSNISSYFGINFKYSFISILSKYCDYATPYYEPFTQMCYDVCPELTSTNITLLECSCIINSTIVNNSQCITNSSQTNATNIELSKEVVLSVPVFVAIIIAIIISVAIFIACICKKCKKK
jgi:hypothetical protein